MKTASPGDLIVWSPCDGRVEHDRVRSVNLQKKELTTKDGFVFALDEVFLVIKGAPIQKFEVDDDK